MAGGLALLMAFGRRGGVIGQYLDIFGIHIGFTTIAVILAQVFVASPFYIRQARASFEAVDRLYEDAARTLGASPPMTVALRITIPLAWGRTRLRGDPLVRPGTRGSSVRRSCLPETSRAGPRRCRLQFTRPCRET
ncbi:hypothetical protein [Methanoculleus chikugoensis]|uniref:hypothetical protein n=1 Tax=Methanoculleus chikugoensis TaxID=118126 RepID=UPI000A58481D|nr:hypothetical protein [Methanoculleus chikugoensis]